MKNIFFLLTFFFLSFQGVSAAQILVEDIFSDISSDYKYRNELQELYDRGMIIPDTSGKFSPNAYLNRDEFVGISMEVICKRCIQPHTELSFLQEYANTDIYFDIDSTNPYFYCVAEADKLNYVRGYDISQSCENGTNKFGERPFCPLNRINLEEAVAVLLRNSEIFTIEDNQKVIENIRNGSITAKLGNDVFPKDELGNPYTFYGYLEKALEFQITQYTPEGKEIVLRLLELDATGKVNPKKSVTKEEFLRMSYIALKSNSCTQIQDNNIALAIDIWEKTCKPGDINCQISQLDDPEDTYDFTPEVEGFCPEGIEDPSGYTWRFYNTDTGEEFFHYGVYLNDIKLISNGEWRVYLTVKDRCGNTGQVYSTIFVGPEKIVEQYIDVDIDVFDDPCTVANITNCKEIEFENEEDDGDDIFDFDGDVSTSCKIGTINYAWTLKRQGGGNTYTFATEFIDNFDFLEAGVWDILLEVRDGCGQTGYETLRYTVTDTPEDPYIDVDIDVFDDPCTVANITNCKEIEFENEEDDGDDIFDFDGDVSTSCKIGTINYAWTLKRQGGGNTYTFATEFIDNFDFLEAGVWDILLEVRDGCGQTGIQQMTYIVKKETSLALSVDILAIPIIGYKDLLVDFEAVVYGGKGPYTYTWDFGDGGTGEGKNIDHLYQSEGVFEVLLIVIDANNLQGSATTLIKVLDADACLQDNDKDGIVDCNDLCPLVSGELINKGCPVLEIPCTGDAACEVGYVCNYDDTPEGEPGVCLPTFDPKSSCLYNPDVGSIFGSALCSTCPCSSTLDFLADMRKCDLIFPAITSPDATQIYSQGKIWQIEK